MNKILFSCLIILMPCICSTMSYADDGTKKETAANAANSSLDLSVPDSPAFKILGLTPNKVDRPSSPREFAASIINGIDTNGNFQSGIALDTAPYLLFNAKNISLEEEYQKNYKIRLGEFNLQVHHMIFERELHGVSGS
jgi:hypothetical protein